MSSTRSKGESFNTTSQTSSLQNQSQTSTQLPSHKDEEKMPLFLIKLWNIVEDPNYQQIIRWDPSGYSFHIVDPYSFCRNVLPHYFKHNNLNSLIRQLNMYGFRKMSPLDRGGLTRSESDQDHLEFSHACFIRDRPDLLVNIKRKQSSRPAEAVSQSAQNSLQLVMDELRQVREKQRNLEAKIYDISKENETLCYDMTNIRAQHARQQQVVQKLVQFLVALVQPQLPKRVQKRGVLAIDENPAKRPRTSSNSGANNNLSEILDRLQRELVDNGGFQRQNGDIPNRGPIIADVTDEWGLCDQNPETLDSDQIMYAPEMRSNISVSPLSQQTSSNGHPQSPYLRKGAAPATQRSPQVSNQFNSARKSYNPPTTSAVSIPTNLVNQQPCSSATYNSTTSPSFTMTPALERQISAELQSGVSGLQEYLNGVDMNIDNCRDLLSGHWDFDFLENLGNEDLEVKPNSGNQLALEQGLPKEEDIFPPPEFGVQDTFVDGNSLDGLAPNYPSTPELLTPSASPRP
ncbi:unnamed protein product [Auanema sp. JU1783]|nr:unnamed protein product [Auanema sp. JU1783]